MSEATTPIQPTNRELLTWLTGITRPVHAPLLLSTCFRFINLTMDVVLFAWAAWTVVNALAGQPIGSHLIAIVIVAAIKALAYYLEQFLGHFVAFKALELLRGYAFSKLWPQAPMITTRTRSGDLLASLTRDVDRIEVVYAHTFAPVISAIVVPPIIFLAIGMNIGWLVVLPPAVCYLLAMTLVPWLGARDSFEATTTQLAHRADLVSHVTDSVFGAEEVVGYGLEHERLDRMEELGTIVAADTRRPALFRGLRRGLNISLAALSVVGLAFAGQASGVDPALVIALSAGMLRIFEGPKGVEDAVGALDASFASARRIWTIAHSDYGVVDGELDYPAGSPADSASSSIPASPTTPAIEWRNVTYHYPLTGDDSQPALRDANIVIPRGSHTVFVGHSGSGKTTAAQLLLRFDDPSTGEILVNGVNARDIRLEELRSHVVLVTQKNQILDTTIADNVRLGAPNASEEDVWAALEMAELADEVYAMPDGLQTRTGQDGTQLSGGQAQRLGLARALIMKPEVLVLDEFSANLNVELDARIRERLARELPGVTIIEVTHRLAHTEHADQVYSFERGTVRPIESAISL
ncbi:ABC transporter ATP-binding protein [Arcanobacterium phocisimile]|uniref:ABC transporter ATP-binding protein n=1 Tax=Arcanobacterium phocisimile TaxID=1302235 RepID=A0ABX7II57_9ACTO|nr:ABC transporter ATP-binding protein [Arcanobacterium phocisimile]QRV02671.1 ABC transporter ATP-binding protein [Arcanobacterium phocisimile]